VQPSSHVVVLLLQWICTGKLPGDDRPSVLRAVCINKVLKTFIAHDTQSDWIRSVA
jgi:hypothetical protein